MLRIVETLTKCQLFAAVDRDYWVALEPLIKVRHYKAKERIYSVGDEMPGLFLIERGAVRFDLGFIEGFTPMITIIRAGQFFGDYEFFDHLPSLATATCTEPSSLIFIKRELFSRIFEEQKSVSQMLARILAKNIRGLTQTFAQDLMLGAEARLAKLFLHLHHVEKSSLVQGSPFIIRYSHEELANMIGLTRTAISKPLKLWKDRGWIEIKNKEIRVFELDSLQRYLEP